MEFPSVPMTSASAPAAPSAGTPARVGQDPKPFTSQGSGKSFSSVLHAVSDQQHKDAPAASDGDPKAQADQAPSTTSTKAANGHDNTDTERSAGTDQSEDKPVAGAAEATTSEPTTQSLLLTLVNARIIEQTPQPAQDAGSVVAPAVSDQESSHPIVPVIAEGTLSSGVFPSEPKSNQPAVSTDGTGVLPSPAQPGIPQPTTNTASNQMPASQNAVAQDPSQLVNILSSPEAQDTQKPVKPEAALKDTQPASQAAPPVQSQGQPVTNGAAPVPVSVPQQEPRAESSGAAQSSSEPERQVPHMRLDSSPAPVQPEKASASREAAAPPAVWQSFSDQQQGQSGQDLSGRERRERQGEDLTSAMAGPAPAAGPSHTIYTGLPSAATDSKNIPSPTPGISSPQAPQPVATPAAPPVDWMPEPSANHARSVVLEVAQADLGRVNIRVAVNQDVVHTYFTSDRSEIGQYLANGQDKLQAAFQNAGLDMGQFRVDIDRQSAGRSFQQPTPQGHHYGYTSQGEGESSGRTGADGAGEVHRHGMLNVVA